MSNTPQIAVAAEVIDNPQSELTIEQRETEGKSLGQVVRKRFFTHVGAMTFLGLLVIVLLLVYSSIGFDLFGMKIPGWWKWGYNDQADVLAGGAPTMTSLFNLGEHPFGQDEIGRDLFARVMRGAQQSLTVMVLYGLVSTTIGIVIGAIAGYYRGWVDQVLMRFTDLLIIIPLLVIASVIGIVAGRQGAPMLGLAIGLFGWTGLARLVRAEFMSLREREFVDAARVAGASNAHIIFRHILPNALGVVIVSATLGMAGAILLEAGLSFLGFGVQAPDVSLGQLINDYRTSFQTRPWLFWWPAALIVIIALAINFIGDGLRDALDPRLRKRV